MLVIFPPAILVGAPVFIGVILVTRYVSLGSLLAITAGAMLVGIWWLAANGAVPFAYPVYATLGTILVWLAHADNVDRLIHGTERALRPGAARAATDAVTGPLNAKTGPRRRDPVRARCWSAAAHRAEAVRAVDRLAIGRAGTGRGLPCRSSSRSP